MAKTVNLAYKSWSRILFQHQATDRLAFPDQESYRGSPVLLPDDTTCMLNFIENAANTNSVSV